MALLQSFDFTGYIPETSQIISTFIWTTIITIVVLALVFALWLRKFNVKYRIRYLRGNKTQVSDDRAKKTTYSDGSPAYQLFWSRKTLPAPPEKSVDIDTKGRMVTEVIITENGDVIYLDTTVTDKLTPIHPTTSSQRLMLARQMEKSANFGKNLLEKNAGTIILASFFLITLTLFLLFGSQLFQPLYDYSNNILDKQEKIMDKIDSTLERAQRIEEIKSGTTIITSEDAEGGGG